MMEHETGHDRAAGDEYDGRDAQGLGQRWGPRLEEVEDEEVGPVLLQNGREVMFGVVKGLLELEHEVGREAIGGVVLLREIIL